ncbi:uncharacterized protein LOC123675211 isoform X1 [Harmonia axyridis]|uniref:uncharacterized protein LOC123675211 isoform X1 n=1 Tax=Harmonia axyridis TaxID=115357 RepID=UPI001E2765B1|nr:uncharacterized protein LOC123675211 isoform X1 [Harmonia axyridis]
MDKAREKVFRRKVVFSDSVTKIGNDGQNVASGVGMGRDKGSVRPRSRSVYTANSYVSDDIVTSRDLAKYEGPHNWHCPLPKPITVKHFYSDDINGEIWADDGYIGGTTVTPHGVISLRLHNRIRVDISLDRAIRIVNMKNAIILALNSSGSSSALIHPNGRVYQYGSRVEILAHDNQGNNKYAKMWYKGVSFTSDQCALVYLVDSAGTRTTTDTFSDLSSDFTLGVFYNTFPTGDSPYNLDMPGIPHGTHLVDDAIGILQAANYWMTEDGTDNWIINSVRISQTSDGLVRVGRNSNKFSLRTSPTNGSASVSSPYMHCTGSMGQTRHLFVRRGERRMHYDGSTFIVRNAGHSAGFDEKQQLKVY